MTTFSFLIWIWTSIAIITFAILVIFKIKAPYGRHASNNWGKMINNNWGWFWMELPAFLIMPILTLSGPEEKSYLTYLLISLWTYHYFFRTLIFPFKLKTKNKKMPLIIVFSALFFNGVNGFINGYFLGYVLHTSSSLLSLNVICGICLFLIGMFINRFSDRKLISLREEQAGYQIPMGGFFKYISCPNHFGEILEWSGFALIAWNLPALTFVIWTTCNLIPRSLNHHEWYLNNFKDYPKNRKAIIPFIW